MATACTPMNGDDAEIRNACSKISEIDLNPPEKFVLKVPKEVLTGKYGEDSKLIYDLQDQGGELLALRYDLTVPFARYVAMNKIKCIKRYQIGKVYRRDQPAITRGRYREFYQCDFDIAGEYGCMVPDVECLRIVYEILSDLNLGDFTIKVNHRLLLDGMFAACGVPSDKFATTCSSVDKLDKLPWSEVKIELEKKGLSEEVVAKIGDYVKLTGSIDLVDRLESDPTLIQESKIKTALQEMRLLLDYCSILGISGNVVIDLSLARGLDYYTGVIFEAVLKGFTYNPTGATSNSHDNQLSKPSTKTKNQKSSKKRKNKCSADDDHDDGGLGELESDESVAVGSVAGGGRYDNLVGMFNPSGMNVPCVGFSFGIERLLAIREMLATSGSLKLPRSTDTDVMVVGAHKNLIKQRLECCRLLWNAKLKATMSHKLNPKILDQLQYCESNGIPIAVILGESELVRNVVKLRLIKTREELEVDYDKLVDEINRLLLLV